MHPLTLGSLCGLISAVALIDKSHFDRLFDDFLNPATQLCNLGAILFNGRSHIQSQQMSQRVHRNIRFAAPFVFVAIIFGSFAAL